MEGEYLGFLLPSYLGLCQNCPFRSESMRSVSQFLLLSSQSWVSDLWKKPNYGVRPAFSVALVSLDKSICEYPLFFCVALLFSLSFISLESCNYVKREAMRLSFAFICGFSQQCYLLDHYVHLAMCFAQCQP